MITKPLHAIEIDDLRALIGTRESRTLEFKREVPPNDTKKITAGVSALANTSGGDFIIGIEEKDGLAERVDGIQASGEGFKQTIEQVLKSGIQPNLPNVDVHAVQCSADRWAFVIRTTRSWLGPHRCLSDNHFYVRTSGSTVKLDVAELRTAFGLRESGIERIEAFRRDRLVKIMAGATPVRLATGPVVVLHLAPLPAFVNRDVLDVVDILAKGNHMPMPLRDQGRYPRVNLNGLCNFPGDDGQGTSSYGQLFRSGAYEGGYVASGDRGMFYLDSIEFANMVVRGVRQYVALQEHYRFDFPTFVMLSFCNAASLCMRVRSTMAPPGYDTHPLQEEVISFPDFVIDSANADVASVLRPLLNIAWNAFGVGQCDMYDASGAWRGM